MKSVDEPIDQRVIAARLPLPEQVRQVWSYRHLLARMIRKELKIKYKNSALGFLWSMLNPALYLLVFWVVFEIILRVGIPNFAVYLLSGLLAWNLFSTALGSATVSVTSNGALISKVYFPREVLPLASVGAAVVHFFLQGVVLCGALAILRYDVALRHLPAVPIALVILLVFTSGLALILAAANVYLRDTQHMVELALLAWFWLTPIVYQQQLMADRLAHKSWAWVQWLNPLTSIVLVFQRAIYNVVATQGGRPTLQRFGELKGDAIRILPDNMDLGWYVTHLGALAAVSVMVLLVGLIFFGRASGNFAEEI